MKRYRQTTWVLGFLSFGLFLTTGCASTATQNSKTTQNKKKTQDQMSIGHRTYNIATRSFDRPWPFGPEE
jgi:hypothetical protein